MAKTNEENFEEIMLHKIQRGESLTESEIKTLVYEFDAIDEVYGEDGRWTRSVCTIISLQGHYIEIDWERGLTECQENEFYSQPYEVFKEEVTKVVALWRPISEKQTLDMSNTPSNNENSWSDTSGRNTEAKDIPEQIRLFMEKVKELEMDNLERDNDAER